MTKNFRKIFFAKNIKKQIFHQFWTFEISILSKILKIIQIIHKQAKQHFPRINQLIESQSHNTRIIAIN